MHFHDLSRISILVRRDSDYRGVQFARSDNPCNHAERVPVDSPVTFYHLEGVSLTSNNCRPISEIQYTFTRPFAQRAIYVATSQIGRLSFLNLLRHKGAWNTTDLDLSITIRNFPLENQRRNSVGHDKGNKYERADPANNCRDSVPLLQVGGQDYIGEYECNGQDQQR